MEKKEVLAKEIIGENDRSLLLPLTFHQVQSSVDELKKQQLFKQETLRKLHEKQKFHIRHLIIYLLLTLVMLCVVPMLIFVSMLLVSPEKQPNFFGYRFFIVSSESMLPELPVGQCIVVKNVSSPSDLHVGDDITFVKPSDGTIVTHRILKIDMGENNHSVITYTTYGINNIDSNGQIVADAEAIEFSDIIGKRAPQLEWFGSLISFSRTVYGFSILIAVVVLTIVGVIVNHYYSNGLVTGRSRK